MEKKFFSGVLGESDNPLLVIRKDLGLSGEKRIAEIK